MDKKKIYTALIIFFAVLIFGVSYYFGMSVLKSKNKPIDKSNRLEVLNESDRMAIGSNSDESIPQNAKLIFKIKYKKSGDYVTEKEDKISGSEIKTKSNLNDKYKENGYTVETVSSSEIIMVKEINKYAPNKYVVGIKDNKVTIFRTDKNGDMYVENEKTDVTEISTDKLKEQDINLLTKGSKYFQCDTMEEAKSRLEDYE